jgi:beta-lactamase class A
MRLRLLLALCLSVLPTSMAIAQTSAAQTPIAQITHPSLATQTPMEILSRLFTEPELQRSWFADSFLAQISLSEISKIIQDIEGSVGKYQNIAESGDGFVLTFEQGTVPTQLVVNAQGQITGLLFGAPQLASVSLDQAVSELTALPGQVHLLVTHMSAPEGAPEGALKGASEKKTVAEANADQPLAVGSTFKLSILQVLRSQIEAGAHQWNDVVSLQDSLKSLPSGFLQDWPAGSQLTIESLATLMISQSDNTATDHLLNLVGRESVEAVAERNRPFLSTREAFVLKDSANQGLLERWRSSTEKQTLLSEIAALPLPNVSQFTGSPQALDIEWFFTAHELCNSMEMVADLPLMSVNPGLVNPSEWDKVSFKGGSEPGVENLTTFLVSGQDRFCVTVTWNHEAGIDEIKLLTLYQSLIQSVRARFDSQRQG